MKIKSNLSKIALALLLSGLSYTTFANVDIDKDKLSLIRMKIQEESLNQELEQGKLNKLRIQQEQNKIKNEMNGLTGSSNNANIINGREDHMKPTEEDILSKQGQIPQNVGFVYKNQIIDAIEKKDIPKNMLDALNSSKSDDPAEISNILKKFDELKKESDSTIKVVKEYVIVKTLVDSELDMLSIYDGSKSAKLKFSYMHDDGTQKRKVVTIVNVSEGKTFKVEDDIYKVEKIDSDGLVIQNTKSEEYIILTKNS